MARIENSNLLDKIIYIQLSPDHEFLKRSQNDPLKQIFEQLFKPEIQLKQYIMNISGYLKKNIRYCQEDISCPYLFRNAKFFFVRFVIIGNV